jgi:hypothetical protein
MLVILELPVKSKSALTIAMEEEYVKMEYASVTQD